MEREETRGVQRGSGGERETLAHTPLMFYSLYRPFLLVCHQGEPVVMREGGTCAGEGQGRCSGRELSSWLSSSPGDAAVPLHNFRGPLRRAPIRARFVVSSRSRDAPEAPASLRATRISSSCPLRSLYYRLSQGGTAPRPVQHVCRNGRFPGLNTPP